jgi:hypothetical protein
MKAYTFLENLDNGDITALRIIMDEISNPAPWWDMKTWTPNYDHLRGFCGLNNARINELWEEAKKRVRISKKENNEITERLNRV